MNNIERNFELFLDNMISRNTILTNNPIQIYVGLSNLCNLKCAFCAYCGFCSKKIEKIEMLPLDKLILIKDFLKTAKYFNPCGRGEPFLYEKFEDFIQLCKENDVLSRTEIVTNGTMLHKHDLKKLKGTNIIAISFDGDNAKTFEILRFRAKFNVVVENIRKLRTELPNQIIQLCVTVNRLNMDELYGIYLIAKELKVNYISYNNIYGPDEDKVIELLKLRDQDKKIIDDQFKRISKDNINQEVKILNVISWKGFEDNIIRDKNDIYNCLKELSCCEPYLDYDKLYKYDKESRQVKEKTFLNNTVDEIKIPYCTGPFMAFFLQNNGDICPCGGAFGTIEHLDNDINKAWNGENIQKLRQAMFNYDMLPDYCRKCSVFMRYDYIDEYLERMEKTMGVDYKQLVIPPNYNPPKGYIKNQKLLARINDKNKMENNISKSEINSKEYWNGRFENNWNDYEGDEQTKYFANLACELLPDWIIKEANENQLSVCDIGCAEGDSLPILKRKFIRSEIYGEDFSDIAIKNSINKYPEFQFKISNILDPEGEEIYPIIFSSNTVEHFKYIYEVIKKLCQRSSKYTIIMAPYREQESITEEHENILSSSNIPYIVEDNTLVYAKTIECHSKYYPGEQILLIYSKVSNGVMLSEIIENVDSDLCKSQRENFQTQILSIESENNEYKRKNREYENENQLYKRKNCEYENENQLYERKCEEYTQQIKILEAKILEYKNTEIIYNKNIEQINHKLEQANLNISDLLQYQGKNRNAYYLCIEFANSKLGRLLHFFYRMRHQFFKGDAEERILFRKWIFSKIRGQGGNSDRRYNPFYLIAEKLEDNNTILCNTESKCGDTQPNMGLSIEQKNILSQKYDKYDVIIFSVIDYDFRFQRPQHFAKRYAKEGHRVFYINANFKNASSVKELEKNLYVVTIKNENYNAIYSTDWEEELNSSEVELDKLIYEYCITDAIMIVDYPNWINYSKYIRKKYGYKIITDYMDDYTGFLNTAEENLKDNCIELLKVSDLVVSSSDFLYNIAKRYNDNNIIVRNGTEFEHFNNIDNKIKSEKIIGYYGAVSHWFDVDKVCYIAKKLPTITIIIIGDVTEHKRELQKYKNIKLLGEIPYNDLPKYLAQFDVCLIPFDTSTDLIKATNPVKFYEYLSAGKKVVATEIPELMPFKDKYVYLANDNKEFLEYIELCIDNKDTLYSPDKCIQFAKENDWENRYKMFEENIQNAIPKVSIIVLTYNNIKYNQSCIKSILEQTAYPNYELIIVDNLSNDGTREWLLELQKENIDNLKIILNEENLGFAGGNNIGIQQATGQYIILLNNDTIISRGWVTSLVKHMENDNKLGMCGLTTNSIGNECMIEAHYTNESEFREFAFANYIKHIGERYDDVKVLPLFCTIIRKKVIDEVGLLDDSYKIGMFEDDDYTEAVLRAGYEISIADDAFIHHYNGGSFKKLEDKEYQKIFNANKEIFEKKWNKKWKMQKYRKGIVIDTNINTSI